MIERISIELTNRCEKGCWFCYNHSLPAGETCWTVDEVVAFALDCAANGVRAVSFGGGEPLQFAGLFEVLAQLDGVIFRSMTTNGLLLDDAMLDRLQRARPDKVHVSIHFPERPAEVERVIAQVHALAERGIKSGVNLLVQRSKLSEAAGAAERLRQAEIGNERIVYLPMRGVDSPTPKEISQAAGGKPFQSMTCLNACAASDRFCSISWDKRVAWCSYTRTRRPLAAPTHAALLDCLDGLGLEYCGHDALVELR
jgi:molybdenum cofactor biosynthesis enzyme MoaA